MVLLLLTLGTCTNKTADQQNLSLGYLDFSSQNVSNRYADFDESVADYAELLNLPSLAVGVALGDSLIYYSGHGTVSPESDERITANHIFPIASITKTFTSVVLHQLEEEERISMDDPISKYPNQYFDTNRWDDQTTISHILSHTSESDPIGTNFIYNGGKFNLVFNIFTKINPEPGTDRLTAPFTDEVRMTILDPLRMEHTLLDFDESEAADVLPYVVTPYKYDKAASAYESLEIDLTNLESGPAYGMLSSVSDLIKYSDALENEQVISSKTYKEMTKPYYPNSPHGLGWFNTDFEGIEMHWAYGYGANDAAILLKVPSKKLTFVLLSSCSIPSESLRLGYGNPLNSMIIAAFIRHFVLGYPKVEMSNETIDSIKKITNKTASRIYVEEAFAYANTLLFSPTASPEQREQAEKILGNLIESFPEDPLWKSATAFELVADFDDEKVLSAMSGVLNSLEEMEQIHPAILLYGARISEKQGNIDHSLDLYQRLADDDSYREQTYKFQAMLKLARYFSNRNPQISRQYLEDLIQYKNYTSSQDSQYEEAIALLEEL